MKIIKKPSNIKKIIDNEKAEGKTIGFIPTMGNLHRGHISLVEKSIRECDYTIVSIFINPLQFSENEDFANYPVTTKEDIEKLSDAGVDLLFLPNTNTMSKYPFKEVKASSLTNALCGVSRPGHFKGVTTIVSKLFDITNPDYAFFGEKDYQQLLIIREMTKDLNLPIKIISGEIIREEIGLAMSSRNSYLSYKQRINASLIFKYMKQAKSRIEEGGEKIDSIYQLKKKLMFIPNADVDYVQFFDEKNLKKITKATEYGRIFIAVYIGKTRLIDNIRVRLK